MAVVEKTNFAMETFDEQYERAENMLKTDPGWKKLTEEEKDSE